MHLHVFPRYDGDGFRLHVATSARERRLLNQDASILRDAMNVRLADERSDGHGRADVMPTIVRSGTRPD